MITAGLVQTVGLLAFVTAGGACIGIVIMSLLVAASDADDEAERWRGLP